MKGNQCSSVTLLTYLGNISVRKKISKKFIRYKNIIDDSNCLLSKERPSCEQKVKKSLRNISARKRGGQTSECVSLSCEFGFFWNFDFSTFSLLYCG